ncbi:hypothetical protein IMG5_134400 [Ichthyophthirius multifiliis]|uniref:Uncharacterized protein n=1 Tax=Ichthyophthirius multifiliis TaxID=5932 RepID=G0QWR3_ICHMU|nr:hypothetical protein IMG5_134400 [Ichthyophthirius multifiliis]EGR30350.1 hypothetical protein IMG5_134400 [Ichthyophthirius multifiliis]|eukprot:XP_004031937.1 hypothetical protein IMG5_134400 [Ichthyophthirius multifiliis]
MSLFQTKEWWSTRIPDEEDFDENHLCVSNIDNNKQNSDRIIVGSYKGYLRIYAPKRREYKIEDLIFEQNFNEPIIQILCGYFGQNPNQIQLAILFFKKILIFECETINQQDIKLKKISQCNLPRNSYNMCQGQFGGQTRYQICIQSCDGMLIIINQDQIQSQVQLSDFLLPSSLSYNQMTDQIILQNSSYEIQAYKISNIGAVSNSDNQKKLLPDWTLNIGDQCLKILTIERENRIHDIAILTEESLYILNQQGAIRSQKYFDYPAANIIIQPYQQKYIKTSSESEKTKALQIIVSSFTNHLMIYEEFQLIWATRTDFVCFGVSLGCFEDQKGLIVGLNDQGDLQVFYLGTEQPQSQIFKEKNEGYQQTYAQIEQKYNQVFKEINNKQSSGIQEKTQINDNEQMNVVCKIQGPFTSPEYVNDVHKYFQVKGKAWCVKIQISLELKGGIKAENIQIRMNLPNNLECTQGKLPHLIEEIKGNGNSIFETFIYILKDYTPSTFKMEVLVSYNNYITGKNLEKNIKNIVQRIELPCAFQCLFCPPIKNANFKITINTNIPCENIQELFKDVSDLSENKDECFSQSNIYSFKYPNDVHTSILCSKTGDKYRIQSSSFEGIYYILMYFFKKQLNFMKIKKII